MTLKRKNGVPDGEYDVSFKVYSARQLVPKLAWVTTMAQAMDQQEVPFKSSISMDGKPRPQDWAKATTLTDFSSYTNRPNGFGVSFRKPAVQTRIRLAANDENIFMLVSCMGVYDRSIKGNELKIFLSAAIEAKPVVLTLDEATGQLSGNPAAQGATCVKCLDDPDSYAPCGKSRLAG